MPTNLPSGYSLVSLALRSGTNPRETLIQYVVQEQGMDQSSTSIAAAVLSYWTASGSIRSVMDSSSNLFMIRVRQGSDGVDVSGDEVPVSSTGASAMSALPPNCTVLVRKRTAIGGRKGRGRFFLPYMLAVTDVDEAGQIAGARLTAIQTAINVWFTQHQTGNNPMYLFHPDRPVGGAAPPGSIIPGGPPTAITDLQAQSLIGSQRRRLGR